MKRLKVTISSESGPHPRSPLGDPEAVYQAMHDLVELNHEVFEILHLDVKHRLIARQTVAVGTLDRALVHPREVFTGALLNGSAAIILVHNHPSGDPSPSTQDSALTQRLAQGARILGIPILDHVVVAAEGFASLGRLGLVDGFQQGEVRPQAAERKDGGDEGRNHGT